MKALIGFKAFYFSSSVSMYMRNGPKAMCVFYFPEKKYMQISSQENWILLHLNNKGADQTACRRSLICTFVICSPESIVVKLDTNRISIFQLVSVAGMTGLSLTC